jgi:hypothetical protein
MIPGSLNTMMMGSYESMFSLDMTTLSLVDPNGVFSSTTARLTATALPRNTSAHYAYYDYGASFFADFSIDFDLRLTSMVDGAVFTVFSIKDSVGAISVNPAHRVLIDQTSGVRGIRVQEAGGVGASTRYVISGSTNYYLRFVRSVGGASLTLYIASSDANRISETWLTTLSVSSITQSPARYLNVISNYDFDISASPSSFYVENATITP